jgi:hypothetical protein
LSGEPDPENDCILGGSFDLTRLQVAVRAGGHSVGLVNDGERLEPSLETKELLVESFDDLGRAFALFTSEEDSDPRTPSEVSPPARYGPERATVDHGVFLDIDER